MSEADSHRPAGVPEPPPGSLPGSPPGSLPGPAPRAWWHPRRLLRGRVRPAAAAALAGVLLGVAGTAWQTGTGPFRDDRKCWGALDDGDLEGYFRDPAEVVAHETSVQYRSLDGYSGLCRLSTRRGAVTVNVHRLDLRYDGFGRWGDEYLAPRLVPMGGGLLGMASDTRAWLALPEGCVGRPSLAQGPTVVDIDTGWTVQNSEVDEKERAVLTRMVVKLVNRILDQEGCSGTVVDPADRLPAADDGLTSERPGAVCRVKGLTLPAQHKDGNGTNGDKSGKGGKSSENGKSGGGDGEAAPRVWITPGDGPVRTCDRTRLGYTELRLMTVSDPRLAALFERSRDEYGTRLTSSRGRGSLSDRDGVFLARCQTGDVAFVARTLTLTSSQPVRALFPRYVEAEAARAGCGTLRVTAGTSGGN
ncbi:hypothetical protein ACFYNZ_15090 [Streptomyces kebangsaanensis]|uniref:DUF3558 domain-containing protein n=1 Tax=Streptomyces kebangsaanensis TaxID=864058 RepID=A0ABW6KSF7_9ACTN